MVPEALPGSSISYLILSLCCAPTMFRIFSHSSNFFVAFSWSRSVGVARDGSALSLETAALPYDHCRSAR